MRSDRLLFIPALAILLIFTVRTLQNTLSSDVLRENHLPKDEKQAKLAIWEAERLMDPATGKIPENIRTAELDYATTLPSSGVSRASTYNYALRGPFNVGGRIRAVAYDVSNPTVVLAGGVSGGIWRSINGGQAWTKVTQSEEFQNVSCLVQDKRAGKTTTWFYGTGESMGNSASRSSSAHYYGNGIYKSTDGGKTWKHLASTGGMDVRNTGEWSIVRNLAIDNSNPSGTELYAATNGIIKRSADGGDTWETVLGNYNSGSNWCDVAVTSAGVVYATIQTGGGSSPAGIYRSATGNPGSFVQILPSGLMSGYQRVVIGIAPSNENVVYFLARTPGTGQPADPNAPSGDAASLLKYTYQSGNGSGSGGAWVNRTANIPNSTNAYRTFDTQFNYNMCIAVKPDNENVVFIGSTNVFRSNNGFSTPSAVQIGGYTTSNSPGFFTYRYPNHHPDAHAFAFHPNNAGIMINATDGGLHLTNDCSSSSVVWTDINNGIVTTQFYTVALDHVTKNDVICGGLQDNGTQWTNFNSSSAAWKNPLMSDGSYCAVHSGTDASGAGYYYFSSQNGATYRYQLTSSGDLIGGNSFARIDPALSAGSDYDFINPFVLDYNDNNTMYMAYRNSSGAKLLRNNNMHLVQLNGNRNQNSTNWVSTNFTGSGRVTALASSISNPTHRLYIGTSSGGVYRVEDARSNFIVTNISSGFSFIKGSYVSDICVHPSDANKIMLTFSNYNVYSVYYSEDGGNTWIPVAGNLEAPLASGVPGNLRGMGNGTSVRSCKIIETTEGDVYMVGTSTGLYAATALDGDNTVWYKQSEDVIGYAIVEKMDYRPEDNRVAIATHGNGVFDVTIDAPGGVTGLANTEIPTNNRMKLYPNPAKGRINVEAPKSFEGGIMTISDLQGRICISKRIGQNIQMIDLQNLSTGLYTLQIRKGNYLLSEKFSVTP
jgi:photosystem II stability/assembly factor-like uncharacterized protein